MWQTNFLWRTLVKSAKKRGNGITCTHNFSACSAWRFTWWMDVVTSTFNYTGKITAFQGLKLYFVTIQFFRSLPARLFTARVQQCVQRAFRPNRTQWTTRPLCCDLLGHNDWRGQSLKWAETDQQDLSQRWSWCYFGRWWDRGGQVSLRYFGLNLFISGPLIVNLSRSISTHYIQYH